MFKNDFENVLVICKNRIINGKQRNVFIIFVYYLNIVENKCVTTNKQKIFVEVKTRHVALLC